LGIAPLVSPMEEPQTATSLCPERELERAYQGLEAKAAVRTGKVTIACVPSVATQTLA